MPRTEINYKTQYTCQKYLVSLVASAFHHCPPEPLPTGISWEMVYQAALEQGVSMLVFSVAGEFLEDSSELYQNWKMTCGQILLKALRQAYETGRITERFSREHIRFLWLKGTLLKDLYEQPGFREMSDLDLLVEPENMQSLRTVMAELGYKAEKIGEHIHDSYRKEPYIEVELHKSLAPDDADNHLFFLYYASLWERLIPDKQTAGMYHMTPEDFYIFHLVHLWRHRNFSGYGIRPFMDIYVYLERYGGEMDWKYLEQEFKKIHLLEFSRTAKELARRWFASKTVPEAVSETSSGTVSEQALIEMEENCFFSGVHGSDLWEYINLAHETSPESGPHGKIRYILHRLWPDRETIQKHYSFSRQHPTLIPFFRIYRIFTGPFRKREFIRKELRLILFRKK